MELNNIASAQRKTTLIPFRGTFQNWAVENAIITWLRKGHTHYYTIMHSGAIIRYKKYAMRNHCLFWTQFACFHISHSTEF